MKCVFKHQRAYNNKEDGDLFGGLWCPDCKKDLSASETQNVYLRLLRNAANVSTSDEQHRLEKEIP